MVVECFQARITKEGILFSFRDSVTQGLITRVVVHGKIGAYQVGKSYTLMLVEMNHGGD